MAAHGLGAVWPSVALVGAAIGGLMMVTACRSPWPSVRLEWIITSGLVHFGFDAE